MGILSVGLSCLPACTAYILEQQCLLSTFLNQLKLVYGLFGQSNLHNAIDFCPRPDRKETNVPLHKGAFCHFPFRWIYFYGSNKSGKEPEKTQVQMTSFAICLVLCSSFLQNRVINNSIRWVSLNMAFFDIFWTIDFKSISQH